MMTWGSTVLAAQPITLAYPKEWKPTRRQVLVADQVELDRWLPLQGLETILALPKGKGNAAVHYEKLKAIYKADHDPKTLKVPQTSAGFKEIEAAVRMKGCTFHPDVRPPRTKPQPMGDDLVVFLAFGRGLLKQAETLEEKGEVTAAEGKLKSLLIMGWHLVQDRSTYELFRVGITLQEQGAVAYRRFLMRQLNSKGARAVRGFVEKVKRDGWRADYKKNYLLESWAHFVSLEACVRCALNDEEAMWREQAVLSLWVLLNGYPKSDGEFVLEESSQEIARLALEHVAKRDTSAFLQKLASWCLKNRLDARKRIRNTAKKG
jgi:hypothetical protein